MVMRVRSEHLRSTREVPIFWTQEYLLSQSGSVYLAGVDQALGRVTTEASEIDKSEYLVLFGVKGELVTVPARAPYGGAWPRSEGGDLQRALTIFIHEVAERFSTKKFEFVFPAQGFLDDVFNQQIEALRSFGAKELYTDLSQGILVNDWDCQKLSKGNRKKLRQFSEAGGVVRKAEFHELPTVYEIIQTNRANIGVSPSISLDQLQKSFTSMPHAYSSWVAELGNSIAAVSVSLRVKPDNEYVYMWADNLEFRNYSPVVALCEGLLKQMKVEGVKILDLGISSLKGEVNENLLRFKSNLGAESFAKTTLTLDFD